MSEPSERSTGPRLTGDAAFNDLKKQIAQRNDEAHRAGRKAREEREKEAAAKRRRRDDW